MPYKDREKQRLFQRERVSRRREEWLAEHGPCIKCGSWENLELHHRDRTQKVNHRIWSWEQTRQEAEAAKCDVLCRICHQHETYVIQRKQGFIVHGEAWRGYQRGCRCDECRAAHAKNVAEWRNKRKIFTSYARQCSVAAQPDAGAVPAGSTNILSNREIFCGTEIASTDEISGRDSCRQ